jgi:hypothetical protein
MTVIEEEVEKIREIRKSLFASMRNDLTQIVDHYVKRSQKRNEEAQILKNRTTANVVQEEEGSDRK